MNESIERLFSLPQKTKLMIVGGLLLTIVFAYWLIFFRDIGHKMAQLDVAIKDPKSGLRVKIIELEGVRRNLELFRAEAEGLEVELRQARLELPEKGQIDTLLAKVSDKAHDAGLEVKSFRPQDEIKHDYYSEQPVYIEVVGSFHEIATFFDEVSRLPRIVNLDSFQIREPMVGDEQVLVSSAVVATTYRFLDESERPKREVTKKKGKKGKSGAGDDKQDI